VLTYKMAIALRPQTCDVTSPYVYTRVRVYRGLWCEARRSREVQISARRISAPNLNGGRRRQPTMTSLWRHERARDADEGELGGTICRSICPPRHLWSPAGHSLDAGAVGRSAAANYRAVECAAVAHFDSCCGRLVVSKFPLKGAPGDGRNVLGQPKNLVH